MTYYSNLKKFDEKGRRLSIFAKQVGDTLNLYVQTCSKKDNFIKRYSKLKAEYYFENGGEKFSNLFPEENPKFFTISVKEGLPKKTFNEWCNTNFFSIKEQLFRNELPTGSKFVLRNNKVFIKTVKK